VSSQKVGCDGGKAHRGRMRRMSNTCTVLVWEPVGKIFLERHFRVREYNIKMDCKAIICMDMDWFNLKTGTGGRFPWTRYCTIGFHKTRIIFWPSGQLLIGLSRRTLHHGQDSWFLSYKVKTKIIDSSCDASEFYSGSEWFESRPGN
jgi:hypothetical protein